MHFFFVLFERIIVGYFSFEFNGFLGRILTEWGSFSWMMILMSFRIVNPHLLFTHNSFCVLKSLDIMLR